MSDRSGIDPETLRRVRAADPLADPRVEADAGLDTEAALRVVLARAQTVPSPAPGSRRRARRSRRRAWQLGVVAVGAAAAAVVTVNVASHGDGEISQALQQAGVAPGRAKAADIIAKVRHSIAAAPGSVLEYEITGRFAGEVDTEHIAQTADGSGTFVDRLTRKGHGSLLSGRENGYPEFYDPATNTIVRAAQRSRHGALFPVNASLMRSTEDDEGVTVDRHATLDGTPAIKLEAPDGSGYGDSHQSLWVSRKDYRPLELTFRPSRTVKVTVRWQDYRTVKPAAGSRSPASLSARYPSATITSLNPPAYHRQVERLIGALRALP